MFPLCIPQAIAGSTNSRSLSGASAGKVCPDGFPKEGFPVYASSGGTYAGYHGTTDENGETVFTLPQGEYRFRGDYDGVQFWSGEVDHCTIPGCLEALVEIPGGVGEVNVTIDYTYDPLNRLTAADYSTGEYFHYSYDAVGNRLTQMTHESSSAYTYDIANRLIEVDGTAFIWDDNGNLIQDDRRIYHYDHANRLDFVSMEGESYNYYYNGLGDRLTQVAGGEFIRYSLDLAAGLTQVLDDGTNTYLYGVKRVGEEQPGGWQVHLGDALGSVRQLTDVSEAVTLAQSYEPFGSLLGSSGTVTSVFQFTGEQVDANLLEYLRARYYVSSLGRFITKDPENGNHVLPSTLHPWIYAVLNPVRISDPSGRCLDADLDGWCDYPPAKIKPSNHMNGGQTGGSDTVEWALSLRCPEGEIDPIATKNYEYYIEHAFKAYPAADSIGQAHALETLRNYEETRKALFNKYGWTAVDDTGMIHDDVFMALILASEIGDYRSDEELYEEAVEALSNQYHGETKTYLGAMACYGRCGLEQQITWATQFEAIYRREDFATAFAASGAWRGHLQGAQEAIDRFARDEDASWFWGNVSEDRLACFEVVVKRETRTYPGRPYFIVYSEQYYSCNP